jgi:hypothetical protein
MSVYRTSILKITKQFKINASRADLRIVTTKFRSNVAVPMLDQNVTIEQPLQHDVKNNSENPL